MLIRLLGVEKQAKENKYEHPFTDVPEWANDYIGYMYEKGLTTGISADKFGATNLIDGKSYATFVLRSLGYNDSKGDFSWNNALEFSNGIGLLNISELDSLNQQDFQRDELVLISYNALMTKLKSDTKTLGEKLAEALIIRPHLALSNKIIDRNNYEIIPVVVRELNPGHNINNYYFSNINNYKDLNIGLGGFTGVWYEPLSEYELLLKLTKSVTDRIEYKNNLENFTSEKGYGKPFADALNDPNLTSPGMYAVFSLYDEEGNPTYFAEIPKGLGSTIGEYELPLFTFNKELIKKAKLEITSADEEYAKLRKDIVIFSNSVIKIENKDNKANGAIMFIDRSKLPVEIQDFVYVSCGGSNADHLEASIYNWIKASLSGEAEPLRDENHRYYDERGISVGDNVYVNVLIHNIDGDIIGATLVENSGRYIYGNRK